MNIEELPEVDGRETERLKKAVASRRVVSHKLVGGYWGGGQVAEVRELLSLGVGVE